MPLLVIALFAVGYLSIAISVYCAGVIICYALEGVKEALPPRTRNRTNDEIAVIRKFQTLQCLAWPSILYYTIKKLDEKEV